MLSSSFGTNIQKKILKLLRQIMANNVVAERLQVNISKTKSFQKLSRENYPCLSEVRQVCWKTRNNADAMESYGK